ncbi:MAG: pseudouridine synthase [Flavipsychrobacter sp.]|jgi:23S rRNA pseudouridine955/2504/2580 synthase/23S rRNA pseudouridine1911/1915/1917 synthase|nr:pseudouridine synthase [Flavipsychrobacter sp.]
MTIETLYEDDDLLIVNKPAGVLVIPDRFDATIASLNKLVEAKAGQKIWVVHRLDRETSGVICFAKNEAAHRYLSIQFQEHAVGKFYAGLVIGIVNPPEGRIEGAIAEHPAVNGKMIVAKKGKLAVTDYKVVEQWPLYGLVQFQIHTGRTHQIRVHMQSIGHPLVCDDLYGDGKPFMLSNIKRKYHLSGKDEAERPLLNRLALHAYRLQLVKEDGKEIIAEAPLPKDIGACVKQLNKWAGGS